MTVADALDRALVRVDGEQPFAVFAIRYGTVTIPRSEAFYEFAHYGEADGPVTMDYYVWLLTSGITSVLVDTGFAAEVGRRRNRTSLCDPVNALDECGVAASDIDTVVVTHFHYDHIGNLHRFPDAQLVVSERELRFWQGPLADRLPFARVVEQPEIEHISARHSAGGVVSVDGAGTVVPGVEVIDVGGHTPGELVVAVSTASGSMVLAADAVHLAEELDFDRPFAIVADLAAFYTAVQALRDVRARGVPVIAGHEPAVFRDGRRVTVGGTTSEHVVRLV